MKKNIFILKKNNTINNTINNINLDKKKKLEDEKRLQRKKLEEQKELEITKKIDPWLQLLRNKL